MIIVTKEGKEFRRKVMENGAEKLMLCYQCGVCTSDCPIAKRVPEFHPRQIARLVMYGQKDRLMQGDLLFLCAGCYTCYEHCPQEVKVSEIIAALRQIALEEGHTHSSFKKLVESIAEMGYIYGFSENVDDIIEHFNYRATIGQVVKNNRLAPILNQYKELELGPDKLSPLEMGYIYEIDEFENEMRKDEDLPPAPEPDVDEVEAVLSASGFLERVRRSK